jgi:hypothetical protein
MVGGSLPTENFLLQTPVQNWLGCHNCLHYNPSTRFQQLLYCWARIRYRGNLSTGPLPRNSHLLATDVSLGPHFLLWSNMPQYLTTLKMEVECAFETLVNFYWIIRHIQEVSGALSS